MGRLLRVTVLVVVFCLAYESCHGATAGRQPVKPILGSAGSHEGKDRAKGVVHTAFAQAGNKPGIETWRIEKFEPIPVSKNDYGKFHTGDSYIILSTKSLGGKSSWDVFFWLGSETSQDESGAAAIYTVQLDDKLGGLAIQHREVQEHESQLFKSLFKDGVKYIPGGVATGLRHVDTKVEKKLYIVKGKKNIRVKQVEPSAASINKGDCFIFDAGSEIYVYQGPKSSRLEKLKSVTAANLVRDIDRNGRSKITVIDEYNNQEELTHFFEMLNSGKTAKILDESAGGDDLEFEKREESQVTLHKVSDAGGSIKVEKITLKPIKQEMLNTNECFILDADQTNVFVWVGKKSNAKEKAEALKKGDEILKSKHSPSWAKVQRLIENAEPSIFRQYFQTWRGVGELHSRLIRDTTKYDGCIPTKPSMYHLSANGNRIQVQYVNLLKQENLKSDDVMIIDNGCMIYLWFGKYASEDEKLEAFQPGKYLPRYENSKIPHFAQVTHINEKYEPQEFTDMFPRWIPDHSIDNSMEESMNEIFDEYK